MPTDRRQWTGRVSSEARPFANRREVLAGIGLTAAAGALTGCVTTSPANSGQAIVLVHGAWHGGWCWDDLRPLLHAEGYTTYAPTMAGLAEREDEMSAEIGLETHISDIERLLTENNLRDVILVGHSYGGMVITAIADRMADRLSHVVYLDAALPADGQSMVSYAPGTTPEVAAATAAQLTVMSPDGISLPAFPATALGIPADHPRLDWVQANMTPHPLKTWLDPISLTNGGAANTPRTYIHCVAPVLPRTGFPAIAKIAKASNDWRYAEMQTGHDAMVTAPAELATLIAAASAFKAV